MNRLIEYNDLTERGKQIHDILTEIYGTNAEGRVLIFGWEMNCTIAQRLDKLLDGELDSHRRTRREFTNVIWMMWPGGDTAADAADQILDKLGVDLD